MQLCLGSSCSQGRIWLCLGTSHSPGLCQGEFCLSLTTKLGDFCSPCHTGSLQLIPKGNQFTWFFVSCSDPRVILPEHFLHARRAGRKHSPVWDHNNVNQSLFITAHHGRQPMGCGPLPCAGTDLSCSQREANPCTGAITVPPARVSWDRCPDAVAGDFIPWPHRSSVTYESQSGMASSGPLDTEQGLGSDSLLDFLHDLPLWKAMMWCFLKQGL